MPPNPSTLLAWRCLKVGESSRTAWEQFRPFFDEHGYRLFVPDPSDEPGACEYLVPPPDCTRVRTEDEYCRFMPESFQMKPTWSLFCPGSSMNTAARSPHNTDVVIRIMSIGDDGLEHVAIMRALAAENRTVTVPMVAELQKDDVIFGVFPFMWDDAMQPWFETVREALDALEQVMEGFVLLHRRLIAHRDFSLREVFMNYGCDWDFETQRTQSRCRRIPPAFRSLCPDLRYLINDFELAVQFAPDSDPKTRLVSGIPAFRYGFSADMYLKPLAPEALLDAPYCPFKADIFQLGWSASTFFKSMTTVPGLHELFASMKNDDPDARPTAAQALATLRAIRHATSEDELNDIPNDYIYTCRRLSPGEACTCSFCAPPRVLATRNLNLGSWPPQSKVALVGKC